MACFSFWILCNHKTGAVVPVDEVMLLLVHEHMSPSSIIQCLLLLPHM